jgi:hypothetical protein
MRPIGDSCRFLPVRARGFCVSLVATYNQKHTNYRRAANATGTSAAPVSGLDLDDFACGRMMCPLIPIDIVDVY